jgi:hypothetical protein
MNEIIIGEDRHDGLYSHCKFWCMSYMIIECRDEYPNGDAIEAEAFWKSIDDTDVVGKGDTAIEAYDDWLCKSRNDDRWINWKYNKYYFI